ncbi:DUF72 domain-containing protein [Bacteroidota bacterium]
MAELRIGTCSWKYDSWRGIIYSDNPNINYLKEYSNHYNTVEIDQWFWSLHKKSKATLPLPGVVKGYNISVPENFKFSIKIPNSITLTHFYRKSKYEPLMANPFYLSEDLYNSFWKTIKPFGDKIGPLMFQFEYLNKQKMKSQEDFFVQVGSFVQSINKGKLLAIETRNPNYLNREYFQFLNDNGLIHVFLNGYYMPSVIDIYEKYREEIRNTVVIRLHGPDRKGIEKKADGDWSRIVESKDEELRNIAEVIKDILRREVDVYLNVNNHYEGCAPLTIEKIKEIFE